MIYIWQVQIKEAYQHLQAVLCGHYDNREAANIADMVLEDITGWGRSKRVVHHDALLSDAQMESLVTAESELLHGRPVQYVLGHCWFSGMKFSVDERVLIPRPETEELVETVAGHFKWKEPEESYQTKMIDIGTGSGCIAISMKKKFPNWQVWALDKSNSALTVAKRNAIENEAEIVFVEKDILKEGKIDHLPGFDLIVSNPPYIPHSDQGEMSKHVLDHEPHLALFVPNNDPLQFYRAIIDFAYHHLLRGGMVFFETHESHASAVAALMDENEFEEIHIKKDMQGKERIVFGRRTGASL